MPPKGKGGPPPPNPVDAVADVVQKLKAVVIADLAGPLKELLAVVETPGGVEEIVRTADAILPPMASCLHGQVAGVLVDELTSFAWKARREFMFEIEPLEKSVQRAKDMTLKVGPAGGGA